MREPYHFKTPKDIAYMLADACIMSVCNCKKGYWHQELDEASSFLTTFNTELGDLDILSCLLELQLQEMSFSTSWTNALVIVIADDIMIVGKKPSHSDHDQALTTLLETARKCNVQLNYEKLQYKKQEVDFLVKHTLQVVAGQIRKSHGHYQDACPYQ